VGQLARTFSYLKTASSSQGLHVCFAGLFFAAPLLLVPNTQAQVQLPVRKADPRLPPPPEPEPYIPAVRTGGSIWLERGEKAERASLKKRVGELEAMVNERDALLEEMNQRMNSMQDGLDQAARDRETMTAMEADMSKASQILTKLQYDLEDERNKSSAREKDVRFSMETLENERDSLLQNLQSAEKTLEEYDTLFKKQNEQLQALDTRRMNVESDLSVNRQQMADAAQMLESLSQQIKEYEKIDAAYREGQSVIAAMEQEMLSQSMAFQKKVEQEQLEKQSLSEALKEKDIDLNAQRQDVLAMQEQRNTLLEERESLTQELQYSRQEVSANIEKIADLKRGLAEANKVKSILSKKDELIRQAEAELQAQQTEFQEVLDRVSLEKETFERQLIGLRGNLEGQAETIDSLKDQIKQLKKEKVTLASDLDSSMEKIAAAQRIQDAYDVSVDLTKDLREKLAVREKEIRVSRAMLDDKDRSIAQSASTQAELEKRYNNMDSELKIQKQKVAQMQIALKRNSLTEEELLNLQQQVDLERERKDRGEASMARQIAVLEELIRGKDAKYEALSLELKENESRYVADTSNKRLQEESMVALQTERDRLRSRVNVLENEIRGQTQDIERKEELLAELNKTMVSAENQMADFGGTNSTRSLQNRIAELAGQASTLEVQLARKSKSAQEIEQQLIEAEGELLRERRLRERLEEESLPVNRNQTMNQNLTKLRTELEDKTAALAALERASKTSVDSVKELEAQLIAMETEKEDAVKAMVNINDELERREADLLKAENARQAAETTIAEMEEELKTRLSTNSNATIIQERDKLKTEVKRQNENIKDLEERLKEVALKATNAQTSTPGSGTGATAPAGINAEADAEAKIAALQTALVEKAESAAASSNVVAKLKREIAAIQEKLNQPTGIPTQSDVEVKLTEKVNRLETELSNMVRRRDDLQRLVMSKSQEVERLKKQSSGQNTPPAPVKATRKPALAPPANSRATPTPKVKVNPPNSVRPAKLPGPPAVQGQANSATQKVVAQPAQAKPSSESKTPSQRAQNLTQLAEQKLKQGRMEEARSLFEESLKLDAGALEARIGLASALISEGNVKRAKPLVTQVLEKDPQNARGLGLMSILYRSDGRLGLASSTINRAITRDPNSAHLYNYRGIISTAQGQLPNAKTALEKAVQIDPTHAEARFNLSVIYISLTPPEKAKAKMQYAEALRLGGQPDPQLEAEINR